MPEWAEVSAILHSSVAGIWHVLQSTFSTAVVGSLTGAFGGAWAAKKIADRSKLREELLKEIRNTNAAATMIYGIANTYIGLKKQHVKRLYEEYHSQRDNFELFLKSSQARMAPPRQTFQFNADLMTLNTPNSPTEQIENIIFNQISITGPVLFVTPILLQSIQSIRETFTERNMLINEFRAHGSTNPYVYFGIGHDNHVDQRYMNTVNGISALNDDVIGLSIMIGEALSEHGLAQRRRYRENFRDDGPAVVRFQFSKSQDLLPSPEGLKDFREMFRAAAPASKEQVKLLQRVWPLKRRRAESASQPPPDETASG